MRQKTNRTPLKGSRRSVGSSITTPPVLTISDLPTRTIDRSRNVVLLFLLYGTLTVTALMFTALLHSYLIAGNHYVGGRIVVSGFCLLMTLLTYFFVRQKQYLLASYTLVIFYALVSIGMAWRWGINLPAALLFSCITIILSGMLLDPSKTLYMAAFLISALFLLQTGFDRGNFHPDLSWTARSSNYGDVIGYAAIFAMLALISWLFGREIIRSLERAEQAEGSLLQEKLLLETRVVERTAKLRVMQLEKVQQLYRFAELGQLSTAMMHELANRLTSLSMDIETLHGHQRSDALKRAQTSLRYIDTMTRSVSKRLHGLPVQRPFDVVEHTKKAIKSLERKSQETGVDIQLDILANPEISSFKSVGDTIQFAQVMTIVLTNALEAYDGMSNQRQSPLTVSVQISAPKQRIVIRVSDHGHGIAADQRHLLFKPFNSNKKQSMGVGLYIAKTILSEHFKGNIRLGKPTDHTEFVITLPFYTKP